MTISGADELTDDRATGTALPFPIVGIGASAGGLAALTRLLEHLPPDAGMAYLVLLNLSPDQQEDVDAILRRATALPVANVNADVVLAPDRVYLVSPDRQLLVDGQHLRPHTIDLPAGSHGAIDLFFRGLAEACGRRTVAIVLSGTGSDGSQGLRRVKECGGITLVQSPADAEHDLMPLNAMATGLADFVIPVADMPKKLVELMQNALRLHTDVPPESPLGPLVSSQALQLAEHAFQEIMALLFERTGHDFTHYKRATVLRRLERRLQVCRQSTLPDYLAYLQANVEETRQLLQDMLISVTNFFRDREAFDALDRRVAARLFDTYPPPNQIRAWVAGCATGEEAYSVAMLLLEHCAAAAPPPNIQVFASDIDERAIATARTGVYADSIATDVPPYRLRNFFQHEDGQYRISKMVREKVTFSVHNLLRDPPFSRLDLVCCRNLLIYLNREAQRQVLETFHFALNPGGLLFLGTSETVDTVGEHFTLVDRKNRIYQANPRMPARRRSTIATAGDMQTLSLRPYGSPHGRHKLLSDIHQQLMDEFAPPSLLVDQDLKIVHASDQAVRFLVQSRRDPQLPVFDQIVAPLRTVLRVALAHAQETGSTVESSRVWLQRKDRQLGVTLLVRPLKHPQAGPGWILIMFLEADPTGTTIEPEHAALLPARPPHERDAAPIDPARGADAETSNEELRAANEELQALNEELRAATEELETSKEELQSVNEELTTVNYELKSKMEETAKANDDLKNLIAASDIATVFVDSTLRIQRFTPRAAQVFNIIATDVGRPLFDITHRLHYDQLAADAREAFSTLKTIEREVTSEDGRWYLVRLLPYRTNENRIDGAVLNFIDITSRRVAEEKLRAGEERMRLVAETTQDYAIITMDAGGLITSWNKGAEQMFRFSEAEVLGQPSAIIFTPEDRLAGVPQEEMRRARECGRAQDERWHIRKDGSRLYCSGILTPLRSTSSDGYAKIARDRTEAKQAEEQREALLKSEQSLRAQLEAASKMKDEFLAVMSHELKNPLNLISMNAELLLRLPDTRTVPSVNRIADTIRSSVAAQAQIINDLLDLSRVQTGKLALHRQAVHWDVLLHQIAEAVRPDASAKGLTLNLNIASGDFTVSADPVRLEQIVWNLVSNAIKFTPPGGTVRLELAPAERGALLQVSDTGQGIEASFLPHVFDMFRQADSGMARRDGGLGIGLALVKRLVEMHGGHVYAESKGLNQGAVFTVWLPHALHSAKPPPLAPQPNGLHGLRILLIDDESETLLAFSTLLELDGAQLVVAKSGYEALTQALGRTFDLIVSDLAMPGMDGYTLLTQLRQAGLTDVPAIAVSGLGGQGDRKRALEAGYSEHLSKPLDLESFLAAVNRLRPHGTAR